MTVRVNKPSFNLREKLSELTSKFGLKGTELARAETVQDARDLVSAGRKNIVINGDMRMNQRGYGTLSSTGLFPVDRFKIDFANGTNTTQQYALSSTDGPPTEKFNYSMRMTSGGDLTAVNSYVQVTYKIESADLFNSGWNYSGDGSTNNYLTVSFWVRSSITTEVNWMFLTHKATAQVFRPETTKLSAGVWTKVIAKIPPNSSINFDDTTSLGASIYLFPFLGSSFTSTPTVPNSWEVWAGNKYGITNSPWGKTSGATFDLTGVQIEVSDNATEFERRTTGEELALCQRYYIQYALASSRPICTAAAYGTTRAFGVVHLPVTMRDNPTVSATSGPNNFRFFSNSNNNAFSTLTLQETNTNTVTVETSNTLSVTSGHAGWIRTDAGTLAFNAEL